MFVREIEMDAKLTLLSVTLAGDFVVKLHGETVVEGEGHTGGTAAILGSLAVDEVNGT